MCAGREKVRVEGPSESSGGSGEGKEGPGERRGQQSRKCYRRVPMYSHNTMVVQCKGRRKAW